MDEKGGGAHIHHNSIHHTRRWGYGYGVWVSGGGMALIEANLFDFSRHHIGSGAQLTSSYEARYNVCLDHDVQPSFDRHGNELRAGAATLIHHNEFRNAGEPAILLRGTPAVEARYHHNWFRHESQQTAFRFSGYGKTAKNCFIYDNHYGPVPASYHPTARAAAKPAIGVAPLRVAFDASASQDNEGGRIVRYQWHFPDTPEAVGISAYEKTAEYTFQEPGRYNVGLMVANEKGIPGATLVPVLVRPPQGDYVLSAWLKDSYRGPLKGFYTKQVLIDRQAVWEEDVAADSDGWQHLVLDVGRWVRGKKEIELAFRLRADQDITDPTKQILECFFYIDEVHLFGGAVKNGDFESDEGWNFQQDPDGPGGFHLTVNHLWSGEARSGRRGCALGSGYGQKTRHGAWTEARQNRSCYRRLARMTGRGQNQAASS